MNQVSAEQGLNNKDNCIDELLQDPTVLAALRPLINSVSSAKLVGCHPTDHEIDSYLRLFIMTSGYEHVPPELVGEMLIYGAAVVNLEWEVLGEGSLSGWVLPTGCFCRSGNSIAISSNDDGTIDITEEDKWGRGECINGDTFMFKNSLIASDHAGRSILAGLSRLYQLKKEIYNQFMIWLRAYSNPAIWGTTAPDAQTYCKIDKDGNKVEVNPVKELNDVLEQYTQGVALALPHGSTVNFLQPQGDASGWLTAIDHIDTQITQAILSQSLATRAAQHGSRATAEVHANIIDLAAQATQATFLCNFKRFILEGLMKSLSDERNGVSEQDVLFRAAGMQIGWSSQNPVCA